jgi:hypothetical protein
MKALSIDFRGNLTAFLDVVRGERLTAGKISVANQGGSAQSKTEAEADTENLHEAYITYDASPNYSDREPGADVLVHRNGNQVILVKISRWRDTCNQLRLQVGEDLAKRCDIQLWGKVFG